MDTVGGIGGLDGIDRIGDIDDIGGIDGIGEDHLEFWDMIDQIEGLSASIGLDRVDGRREVYEKTLKLFISEIEKCNSNLSGFLANSDMDNFRVVAHSMKSALANVGAMDLATKAYKLETAASSDDSIYCSATLQSFLNELNRMKLKLQEAFLVISEATGAGPTSFPPELTPIFENMLDAFDETDLLLINNEIENLNSLRLNGALKEDVEQIKDAVMIMDYDVASDNIRRLLKSA
jgi:HPt (histidine-containing phosphotransfer) domain-containing protein